MSLDNDLPPEHEDEVLDLLRQERPQPPAGLAERVLAQVQGAACTRSLRGSACSPRTLRCRRATRSRPRVTTRGGSGAVSNSRLSMLRFASPAPGA